MCFHCEDTGLLEIQILLCFTTAYLQVDPEKMDHIKKFKFLGGIRSKRIIQLEIVRSEV